MLTVLVKIMNEARSMNEVLLEGFPVETENGFGLVGQVAGLWEVQNEAKAFSGDQLVNAPVAVEEGMAESEKLSKDWQKLEVYGALALRCRLQQSCLGLSDELSQLSGYRTQETTSVEMNHCSSLGFLHVAGSQNR